MALANLALRFVIELVAVVALGYWGFTASAEPAVAGILGIGLPLAVVVLWARVVAPRAPIGLAQARRDVIGTVILLTAALALLAAGQPVAGLAFGAVVIVNAALLAALGDDARTAVLSAAAGPRG